MTFSFKKYKAEVPGIVSTHKRHLSKRQLSFFHPVLTSWRGKRENYEAAQQTASKVSSTHHHHLRWTSFAFLFVFSFFFHLNSCVTLSIWFKCGLSEWMRDSSGKHKVFTNVESWGLLAQCVTLRDCFGCGKKLSLSSRLSCWRIAFISMPTFRVTRKT